MIRSDFIELLSNFTFWIYFHDEKYSRGKIVWDEISNTWGSDESKDYWNFFIQINSHHTDYVIENWHKNDYKEFLEYHLKDYIKQNELMNLSSMSQSECFDILHQEFVKLNHILKLFYTKMFIDDDNSGRKYGILWHHSLYLEIADDEKEKQYRVNGDRFFNEQISFYLSKQKEIIDFVISFLDKKIQLIELYFSQVTNIDDLKTIEYYPELMSNGYSNLISNKNQRYFSFVQGELKLEDINYDYIRNLLLQKGVIEEVDYRDFRRLFKNELLMRPIVWIGKESLLHYFIKTLIEKKIIKNQRIHWIMTSICFVIKENERIRRVNPYRIARLKPPKKDITNTKFDSIFSFINS
jgi:hypothetical protein